MGLVSLVVALIAGRTVFRAVSVALLIVVVASLFHRSTRPDLKKVWAFPRPHRSRRRPPSSPPRARSGSSSAWSRSRVSERAFRPRLLSVAGEGLLPALLLIMVGSVVLGMGLPSAVCYLLMAILIGPVIGQLGVPPLSVHFFIFYFGMMSMVTPPVALAAYTTAGIANTPIIPAALTAFRFALAGFALTVLLRFPAGTPPDPGRRTRGCRSGRRLPAGKRGGPASLRGDRRLAVRPPVRTRPGRCPDGGRAAALAAGAGRVPCATEPRRVGRPGGAFPLLLRRQAPGAQASSGPAERRRFDGGAIEGSKARSTAHSGPATTWKNVSALQGPKVAVTLARPTPAPVTSPFSSTDRIRGFEDDQTASTVAEGPSS